MTWVKLDDRFPEHPKVMSLSDRAFRAFIKALCYCGLYDTDGSLPPSLIPPRVLRELLEAGLIDRGVDGASQIHDYLDYNPSREQVENERRKARERRQKGGRASPDGLANVGGRSGDVRATYSNPDPTRPDLDPKAAEGNPPAADVENSGQVPDRWPYLLGKLYDADPRWRRLSIAACRRIASETSETAVSTALGFAAEAPPDLKNSAFGWLQATARGVAEDVPA